MDAFAYYYAVIKYKQGNMEYFYIPKAYRNEEFDKIVAMWQETFKDENLLSSSLFVHKSHKKGTAKGVFNRDGNN